MSIRVHELAKELKLSSKELIDALKAVKISAKNHMSVVEEAQVKLVKESLKKGAAPAKATASAKAAAPAKSTTSTKPAAPAKPAAIVKTEKPRESSSLENVKKELLLQRTAAKATPTSSPVKKSHISEIRTQTASIKKAEPAPITPKAAQPAEPKNIHKAAVASAPIVPQSPIAERLQAAAQAAPAVAPKSNLAPTPEVVRTKKLSIHAPITVKELAGLLSAGPSELIQKLIKLNIFANINQSINFEVASKVALEFGYELEEFKVPEQSAQLREDSRDKAALVTRAPIVTLMGHVDHGKTSLLDAIRKTKVAAGEAGGITQHIGAYEVFLPKGAVTFLDTPGHEAFTAMRARGARATDVVVLVVGADDGVMPQTIEAIDHAKAAGVPIIVAINKMDLPSANPERVKKDLMTHGLMAEEWGGKTIMVGVSAKTGKGIDELLDLLVLESDLLELKADPKALARGVVVEAELSKESGVLATVLVQDGTLRVGDVVIVGTGFCKVRAMINDRGQRIKEALPSMPVEILGLSIVPKAGDQFYVVKDERIAKEIIEKQALNKPKGASHITLEHLFEDIKAGKVEELKLIIKSDVQGSVEALRATLGKIQSKNVRLNIIHTGVGDITESDVMLAIASNAVIIGFHVSIVGTAKEAAEKEEVDVRFYEIIYEAKNAIEKAMEGLLQPEYKEIFMGQAEVRQVFKVSKVGVIAGCSVLKGKIVRNQSCRVIRNGAKIHEGKITSLKRFKDDAREVLEGFECGIGVSNFNELLPSDRIEAFEIQEKARKLE